MGARRTKIICTIGPAVNSTEKLQQLAAKGMDVARLNFSHGSHEEFNRIIQDLRLIEQDIGRPIGIMADIQGPKIRVGKLPGEQISLVEGEEVWITSERDHSKLPETGKVIPCTYKDIVKDVGVGHQILLDDGLMALEVTGKVDLALKTVVINGGSLKNNKGINVPEVSFSVHAITEKDYGDILFCLEKGVDYLALSFVRTDQEVRHLKEFIETRQKATKVFAKIEMREAITNLDAIIGASDGILVARGDLAVEIGNERVPVLQKKIVRQCNLRGKPVIIATQMLMSMVNNPRPTRAEASDVANAILDGTDAVMLSNETAVGHYPLQSLGMMDRIVREMEIEGAAQIILYNEWQLSSGDQKAIALLQSAVRLASIVRASAIVVLTESGQSSLLVSKCRPQNRLIAVTDNLATYRQSTGEWGVDGIYMEDMDKLIKETTVFEIIGQRLLARGLCRTGDKIVITAGLPRLEQGGTNTIKLHQI